MALIFVDCEAPMGVGAPSVGDMTEFGAVNFKTKESFHGKNHLEETFRSFETWLTNVSKSRPVFVSDNPGYDFQWINFYFWRYLGYNPFGHSARRISDFYAGLVGNFYRTQDWKKFRKTPHDHNPVNDAMGNVEAFETILKEVGLKLYCFTPKDSNNPSRLEYIVMARSIGRACAQVYNRLTEEAKVEKDLCNIQSIHNTIHMNCRNTLFDKNKQFIGESTYNIEIYGVDETIITIPKLNRTI